MTDRELWFFETLFKGFMVVLAPVWGPLFLLGWAASKIANRLRK